MLRSFNNNFLSYGGRFLDFTSTLSDDFIIRVKTDNAGTSASNQFTFTGGVGGYDVLAINQSTLNEQTFTGLNGVATLTFSEGAGVYVLKITPTGETPFNRLAFSNGGDRRKVLEHMNYGNVKWSNMYGMYWGCDNITFSATDTPDLSEIITVFSTTSGMASKWRSALALTSVSYNGYNLSRLRSFASKHAGATSLVSIDYRNVIWNTTDSVNCSGWFESAPAVIQGLESCNIKPSSLSTAFLGVQNTFLDLSSMDTSLLTTAFFMLRLSAVEVVDCTGWDWSGITSLNLFASPSPLTTITGLTVGQDMTSCTDMSSAFRSSSYNQYFAVNLRLAGANLFRIFQSSGMSTANYTDTIVYWANYAFDNAGTPINVNMAEQTGRTYDTSRSGGANFANAGVARTYLISTIGWTISGDTVI